MSVDSKYSKSKFIKTTRAGSSEKSQATESLTQNNIKLRRKTIGEDETKTAFYTGRQTKTINENVDSPSYRIRKSVVKKLGPTLSGCRASPAIKSSQLFMQSLERKLLSTDAGHGNLFEAPIENNKDELHITKNGLEGFKPHVKPIVLFEHKNLFLKTFANTYVLVKVDMVNQKLPALVFAPDAPPETEFFLGINYTPTPISYLERSQGNRIIINQSYQGEITKPFSIKILILAIKPISSDIAVYFLHEIPKLELKPLIKKADLHNYKDYFDIALHKPRSEVEEEESSPSQPQSSQMFSTPEKPAQTHRYRASLQMTNFSAHSRHNSTVTAVDKNIQAQGVFSRIKVVEAHHLTAAKLDDKISEAKKKKADFLEKKCELIKVRLQKAEMAAKEKDEMLNVMVRVANKQAFVKAWTINLYLVTFATLLREKFVKHKLVVSFKKRINKKLSFIQKLWRLTQLKKYSELSNIANAIGGLMGTLSFDKMLAPENQSAEKQPQATSQNSMGGKSTRNANSNFAPAKPQSMDNIHIEMCDPKEEAEQQRLEYRMTTDKINLRMVLSVHCVLIDRSSAARARTLIGRLLESVSPALRLRFYTFNYNLAIRRIQTKFRKHLQSRFELFKKFSMELEKVVKDLITVETSKGKSYVKDNIFVLGEGDKTSLFDYLFNNSLLTFLPDRFNKMKKLTLEELRNTLGSSVVDEKRCGIVKIEGLAAIRDYVSGHKHRSLFELVNMSLESNRYGFWLEAEGGGRGKPTFARKESMRLKRRETKQDPEEAERAGILEEIERRDLGKIFEAFGRDERKYKMQMSYSKQFLGGLILTLLEFVYKKERPSDT